MTTPQTTPPGAHPDWCVRDRCYGDIIDAAFHAAPEIRQSGASAEVAQYVEWIEGVVLESEPGVLGYLRGDGVADAKQLTSAECRDLAAVLLQAADQLDTLTISAS